MTGAVRCAAAVVAALAITLSEGRSQGTGPLDRFSTPDGQSPDGRQPMVDIVRDHGVDVGIIGVVRTTADDDRLFAWFREIEQFQQSAYVPILQRFSATPQTRDVAQLVLDESELQELKACRPGDCDMKLAGDEIAHITNTITAAGGRWRDATQRAFRSVLVARGRAFLQRGLAGTPGYHDRGNAVVVAEDFEKLFEGCSLAGLGAQAVAPHFRRFPDVPDPRVETFLFWSRDLLGDAKPIVGVTAVSLFPAGPSGQPPVAAAIQLYASHYITSSISLTAIVPAPDRATRYLVYRRCTRADVFGGPFGNFVRRMVNRRVREEGPALLDGIRHKLEGGLPRGTAGQAPASLDGRSE